MTALVSFLKRWPASTYAALQTLAVAVVGVLSAFNLWSPTDKQVGALSVLWVAASALGGKAVRSSVTANVTLPAPE